MDVRELQDKIKLILPEGRVKTAHTETEHFYNVYDLKGELEAKYPSVTKQLQVLKDPSLANYKMNRAVDYIYRNFSEINETNLLDHLKKAKAEPEEIFMQAGHIGTQIHDYREEYFLEWIETGKRPADILKYIPEEKYDVRAVSGLRALDKFVDDYDYVPVACELYVYSHAYKCAGMLDDIGIMTWKGKRVVVLMDLKTSNQFKDHYFFQVGLYYDMFKQLVKLAKVDFRIDKALILKVSKENGSYRLEDLESPSEIATYSVAMLRVGKGLEMIQNRRTDNNKKTKTI